MMDSLLSIAMNTVHEAHGQLSINCPCMDNSMYTNVAGPQVPGGGGEGVEGGGGQ